MVPLRIDLYPYSPVDMQLLKRSFKAHDCTIISFESKHNLRGEKKKYTIKGTIDLCGVYNSATGKGPVYYPFFLRIHCRGSCTGLGCGGGAARLVQIMEQNISLPDRLVLCFGFILKPEWQNLASMLTTCVR